MKHSKFNLYAVLILIYFSPWVEAKVPKIPKFVCLPMVEKVTSGQPGLTELPRVSVPADAGLPCLSDVKGSDDFNYLSKLQGFAAYVEPQIKKGELACLSELNALPSNHPVKIYCSQRNCAAAVRGYFNRDCIRGPDLLKGTKIKKTFLTTTLELNYQCIFASTIASSMAKAACKY